MGTTPTPENVLTMRRIASLLCAGLLTAAPVAGGTAGGTGLASPNVEYLQTVPVDGAGAQVARIVDGYLYLASYRSFSIYDVSAPEDPQLVSSTPLPSNPNESIDTNGRILILKEELPVEKLMVWDVTDKASPALLSEVSAPDHTVECILD